MPTAKVSDLTEIKVKTVAVGTNTEVQGTKKTRSRMDIQASRSRIHEGGGEGKRKTGSLWHAKYVECHCLNFKSHSHSEKKAKYAVIKDAEISN